MTANGFLPHHAKLIDAIEKHAGFSALPWLGLPVLAILLFALLVPASQSARRDPAAGQVNKEGLAVFEAEPTTPSLRAALGLAPATLPQSAPAAGPEGNALAPLATPPVPRTGIAALERRNEAPESKLPIPSVIPLPPLPAPAAAAPAAPAPVAMTMPVLSIPVRVSEQRIDNERLAAPAILEGASLRERPANSAD